MRRTTSRRFPASKRRKLVWGRLVNLSPLEVAAGAATATNLLTALETDLGAQVFGATVMRIRGELMIYADNADAGANLVIQAGYGITVSDAAGTPNIFTDEHQDWMGYQTTALVQSSTNSYREAAYHRLPIDIRSRRKLDEVGQQLTLVQANSSLSGASVFFIRNLSVLLMLS